MRAKVGRKKSLLALVANLPSSSMNGPEPTPPGERAPPGTRDRVAAGHGRVLLRAGAAGEPGGRPGGPPRPGGRLTPLRGRGGGARRPRRAREGVALLGGGRREDQGRRAARP